MGRSLGPTAVGPVVLTPVQAHRRYIASAEWAMTRRRYRAATRPRRGCRARSRRCAGALHLHHRDYTRAYQVQPYRAFGRERRRDLADLCDHHHAALHRFEARWFPHQVKRASRWYLRAAWTRRHALPLIVLLLGVLLAL